MRRDAAPAGRIVLAVGVFMVIKVGRGRRRRSRAARGNQKPPPSARLVGRLPVRHKQCEPAPPLCVCVAPAGVSSPLSQAAEDILASRSLGASRCFLASASPRRRRLGDNKRHTATRALNLFSRARSRALSHPPAAAGWLSGFTLDSSEGHKFELIRGDGLEMFGADFEPAIKRPAEPIRSLASGRARAQRRARAQKHTDTRVGVRACGAPVQCINWAASRVTIAAECRWRCARLARSPRARRAPL
jgi:hypothetical protein